MSVFLCTVSHLFPENYEIGLRSGAWGVEEKYKNKINRVGLGDKLVFVVGGIVRSIHTIESTPYFDTTPLWPSKDGSVFPLRVRIREAEAVGELPLREIANDISFMRGKKNWGGTIQGPNGVFNPYLTQSDLDLITRGLSKLPPRPRPKTSSPVARDSWVDERQKTLFKFYERDIEDRIVERLPAIGLNLYHDRANGRTGKQYACDAGRIDLLCQSKSDGQFVIVELKKGQAPNETLLQVLRYMSWVRQNLSTGKPVKGIILTESADSNLKQILGEVPNVSICYYAIDIKLPVNAPDLPPSNRSEVC